MISLDLSFKLILIERCIPPAGRDIGPTRAKPIRQIFLI